MSLNTVGLRIGHYTDHEHHTGCTVFLCPPGTVASGDVRGPAPGSRETALLAPDKAVPHIHAVLLTGGSALGLAAADGVMRYLSERAIGHPTPLRPIPLVPTAVAYDLFLGGWRITPTADWGYAACEAAVADNPAEGNVGVGAGLTVGKWGGFAGMMKSGFGLVSAQVGELVVFAAAAVNAVGDVVAEDGRVLAGARNPEGGWEVARNPFRLFGGAQPTQIENTTLVVTATNARLDKVQAYRLAQRAHDGMAQAVRPIHTTHDGDTAFALSTGSAEAPFDWIANMACELAATAVRRAVLSAASLPGLPGLA